MTNGMRQTAIKNPTWWKRRSGLERGLTVIAVSVFLLCVIMAVALGILAANTTCDNTSATAGASTGSKTSKGIHPFHKGQECDDICLTPGCIRTASEVLGNMDPDVEPCDDFFKFACGKFNVSCIIPDDKKGMDVFYIIDDVLSEKLRISIEQESLPNEPRPFRLVKDFYKACMNTTVIEQRGLQPLLDNLKRLGGWPVLEGDRWNDGDFTWQDSVYRFRRLGYPISYFIEFEVGIDLKNVSRRLIYLDQASLGLSREYLSKGFDEKLVQAYYRYMVDIAVILGANRERAREELKQSLEFEIKLANISVPNEKRRDISLHYNPMTVSELSAAYPSIPWWEYVHTILATQARLNRDEIINVVEPTYLKGFEQLVDQTPKRVVANYAIWRAIAARVTYLTENIRKRQLRYTMELDGKTQREPRWRECIDVVSRDFGISVGSMYVRKYFEEDAKRNAVEMVNDVKQEFIKLLKKEEWMDEKTRANALEKAYSMTSHIAYPDELLDDRKLEEFYSKLEIRSDDYLGNIINLSIFETDFSFSRLGKLVNKTEWISYGRSAIVNAFYRWHENSIQLPAGILQGAFFSNDRPRYMNYGGIGTVIGHEITHGFDDQGRQFNKDGNLADWWEPETKKQYLKRAECIIHQYGNYTVKEVGMNLNGINTQGENIADNSGMKEAYYAYREWVKRNGQEQRLPGLPFTPEQMFWISAANTWCSKYRPEKMKLQITTGAHSLAEFRILGPISNMAAFARDFNCPLGSKMNPEKKCIIW